MDTNKGWHIDDGSKNWTSGPWGMMEAWKLTTTK